MAMANAHAPDTNHYYVPHDSPWPIRGSLALFVIMAGGFVLDLVGKGMGWDNFGPNLKTNKSGVTCNDSSGTHGVSYAADVASLNGHWELIRWGGNSFQFKLNSAPLGEIECALPALSGMAIDFHEGGTGLAQSTVDNFRVEVCASAP